MLAADPAVRGAEFSGPNICKDKLASERSIAVMPKTKRNLVGGKRDIDSFLAALLALSGAAMLSLGIVGLVLGKRPYSDFLFIKGFMAIAFSRIIKIELAISNMLLINSNTDGDSNDPE
jgi:hypothetical protein